MSKKHTMDSTPMTVTSFAVLLLLVIFLIALVCHFLGPSALTWMRSNKEEKIGLSKNKLFHANGYMIHSGSEFLLSTSGSFKRFDTIDKDFKQTGQHPAQRTSPLWNLPQTDHKIPPQPLRPAPAPTHSPPTGGNSIKTVKFSFSEEQQGFLPEQLQTMETPLNGDFAASMRPTNEHIASSRQTFKQSPIPQRIQAPPTPRFSTPTQTVLSASAIPRPTAKRQPATIQNEEQIQRVIANCNVRPTETHESKNHEKPLYHQNSNTNPFLCENVCVESNTQKVESNNALPNTSPKEIMLSHATVAISGNIIEKSPSPQSTNGNNPFYSESINSNSKSNTIPTETSTDYPTKSTNGLNSDGSSDMNLQSESLINPVDSTKSAKSLSQSPLFRNRSFSETEASDPDLTNFSTKISSIGLKLSQKNNPFVGLTQKVKGPKILQKTLSEDFLFRNIPGAVNPSHGNTTWSFGRSFLRQDSMSSIGRRNSSQVSLDSTCSSMDSINLERAVSCDSVNSESSVALSDLEQPYTQITGYLCVGLQYDKTTVTDEGMDFIVTVIEAKEIMCPSNLISHDTFVRIYLVPDQAGAMQTKIISNTLTPRYNESFTFWFKKQHYRHSLWFHLYHNGSEHTLLGEAEMEICEMPRPITTWIPLSDSRKCNAKWGELMFSLSYLPTAERLTIVVVKARNLNLNLKTSETVPTEVHNIFVKIYLMNNDKKILKKRTSLKRKDRCPIFNESVIFSLPPHSLTTVQLRLTVFGVLDNVTVMPLGHVIVGSCATGKGLRHWHQMLSSLRKPVAMWHILRRATKQPIFTGGAEAVIAALQSTAIRTKRNSVF